MTRTCWWGGRLSRQHVRADDGMVIAEAAVVIPVLTVVALALAWGVSLVGSSMVLADAARQVARDVARGVPVPESVESAQARAPQASITVQDTGADVTVIVRQEKAPPIPALSGLTVSLQQSVAIPREWS